MPHADFRESKAAAAGACSRHVLAVFCWAIVLMPLPANAEGFDPPAIEKEAVQFLSEYIRIDTSNPPGNETAAARFLAKRFEAEKIEAKVYEAKPGRGSILARIKGTGEGRPIILLNHLDVVPAAASEWKVAPFDGVVRDGFVHGRGALDCKGVGVAQAMAMFILSRSGVRLTRDVIFLGTADEEAGGKLGAGWMVENHFDQLADAEILLNEGGAIRIENTGRRVYNVAVSEKTPFWLRLTGKGEGGHSSVPPLHTPVTRLVRALERLQSAEQPVRVTPQVQTYFAALAALQEGANRERFTNLRSALEDESFRKEFLANRRYAALVRNTLTPTILLAGMKTNVIPPRASAELDCRLLPDEDPQRFLETIRQTIDDSWVHVEVLLNFPPSASTIDSKLYRLIEHMAAADNAIIAPTVLAGFTDSHYFRDKGIVSYGFTPFALDEGESNRMHGVDERVSAANLRDGATKLFLLLLALDDLVLPAER